MKFVVIASVAAISISGSAFAQELTTSDNPSSRMDQTSQPATVHNTTPGSAASRETKAPSETTTSGAKSQWEKDHKGKDGKASGDKSMDHKSPHGGTTSSTAGQGEGVAPSTSTMPAR